MGQESWHFPYWSLHSKWRSNILLLLHLTFKCEDYIWCISMQCLMHFVSMLDNHPLFEKLRLCYLKELSLKNQDVQHQCLLCDISRWIVIFLDEVYLHTSFRPWNWWKLLLMPSKVCDISECPLLVTLYLIPREDLRSFSLKRYLLSVYSINAVIFIIPVLMMMRMWDSPGERFYHKPSDKFWELKLDLDQGRGWGFGSLRNGCRYMLYFMTFEPRNWARLEICYWRSSLFWNKSNTCYDYHISDQSFYCWWLTPWEDCTIKRARQSYWWRIGDICSPIYYQTFLICYFLLAALSWRFLMCFQWIFDWSVSLIAKWKEHYMLTFAGEFSQDIIVIGKMRCETLYGLSWWSILLVLIG